MLAERRPQRGLGDAQDGVLVVADGDDRLDRIEDAVAATLSPVVDCQASSHARARGFYG